jgi:D-ribose pyranose/furanose isomerase RbsD
MSEAIKVEPLHLVSIYSIRYYLLFQAIHLSEEVEQKLFSCRAYLVLYVHFIPTSSFVHDWPCKHHEVNSFLCNECDKIRINETRRYANCIIRASV